LALSNTPASGSTSSTGFENSPAYFWISFAIVFAFFRLFSYLSAVAFACSAAFSAWARSAFFSAVHSQSATIPHGDYLPVHGKQPFPSVAVLSALPELPLPAYAVPF